MSLLGLGNTGTVEVRLCMSSDCSWASQVALVVKNLAGDKRGKFDPWGVEDPLEEEMATLFSTIAWRIPWTEEPAGLQSRGSQRVGHDSD